MINGNIQSFLEKLSGGENLEIRHNNIEFQIQGYHIKNIAYMEMVQTKPFLTGCIWKCKGNDLKECNEKFFNAKIFNNKTFWEAEQEIEWID